MKKRGFTLIELLAVIVILAVLSAVVIPSVFTMIRKAKVNSYNILVESFESNARLYVTRHRDEVEDSLDLYNYYTLTLNDLKDDNLLKTPVTDPRSDEVININKKIIVTRETDKSLDICYEDRNCYIPILLANELTKEGNVVSGTTEGLHYDATNDFYYYRGSNPKNWIEFNGFLWRIVKINTDGSIKLIYEGVKNATGTADNGTVFSGPFDTGNLNNYNTSISIKTSLQTWYNNNITNTSKIQSSNWCIGQIAYATTGTLKATFLNGECGTKTTASSPVGLISGSEYLYASLDSTCLNAYKTTTNFGYTCKNNNYLYKSAYDYWSLTGDTSTTNVWKISASGSLGAPIAANTLSNQRPVINLIASVIIDKGTGTFDSPYILKDIINIDKEKPVITILGSSPVNLYIGDSYVDAGATAYDNVDGSITSKIVTVSNLNVNIAGFYNVTYTVSDVSGNKKVVSRNINVREKGIANAPSITTGLIPIKWNGTSWVNTNALDTTWYNYETKKWANAATIVQNQTIIKDLSNNGYDAVLLNGAFYNNDGLSLDGIDDYVKLPTLSATDNWKEGVTIEFTAKWDTFPSWSRIIDFGNGAAIDNILIGNYSTLTDLDFSMYTSASASSDTTVSSASTIKANYKIEIVKSGTNYVIKGYVNGTLSSTTTVADLGFLSNINRIYNYIGKSNWGDPYFDGTIYNLKITQKDGKPIVWYDFTDSNNYFNSSNYYSNFMFNRVIPTDLINTMWVWIPRYAYQIASGYHTSTAGTINVKFLKGTTNNTMDGTGIDVVPTYSGSSQTNYIKHPSFTFGSTEVEGIWVTKFEISIPFGVLASIPNYESLRNRTINDMFNGARSMETNSVYGWGTTGTGIDTHMMKNSEWGAASYLAQSTYGKNSEVWINNSNTYITGCAGATATAAPFAGCENLYSTTNGVQSSTSGNIYGIYDLYGGTWEYTAAYVNNGTANLTTYGSSIMSADGKYKDVYQMGSTDNNVNNYNLLVNKNGDALYETSANGTDSKLSWYADTSSMPRIDQPWFVRGGDHNNGSAAGAFNFVQGTGGAFAHIGFRTVLLVGAGL